MSRALRFLNSFLFLFDRGLVDSGWVGTVPAPLESPRASPERIAKRDALRRQVEARGLNPNWIEPERGQCPTQVEAQIPALEEWLKNNPPRKR